MEVLHFLDMQAPVQMCVCARAHARVYVHVCQCVSLCMYALCVRAYVCTCACFAGRAVLIGQQNTRVWIRGLYYSIAMQHIMNRGDLKYINKCNIIYASNRQNWVYLERADICRAICFALL